ncbi:hypothetical protein KL929_003829 [Ogataea haglerorum]|nr:hypothetical protein KL929_003829 [Ogataea haglerorum]
MSPEEVGAQILHVLTPDRPRSGRSRPFATAARFSGQQDGAEVPKSAVSDEFQHKRASRQARSAQRQHDPRAATTSHIQWIVQSLDGKDARQYESLQKDLRRALVSSDSRLGVSLRSMSAPVSFHAQHRANMLSALVLTQRAHIEEDREYVYG